MKNCSSRVKMQWLRQMFFLGIILSLALIMKAGFEPVTACSGVPPFDPAVTIMPPSGDIYEDEPFVITANLDRGTSENFNFPFDTWWSTGSLPYGDGSVQGINTAAILPATNKRAIECTGVPPAAEPILGISEILIRPNMSGSAFDNPDYINVLSDPIGYKNTYFPGDIQGYLFHILPSHGASGSGGAWDRFVHKGCPNASTILMGASKEVNIVDMAGTTVEVVGATYDIGYQTFWNVDDVTVSFDMDPEVRPQSGGSPQEAAQTWYLNQGDNGPERSGEAGFPIPVANGSNYSISYKYSVPGHYSVAVYAGVIMTIQGKWTWKEKRNGTVAGPFSIEILMKVIKRGTGINAAQGNQQTNCSHVIIKDKTPPTAFVWTNGSEELNGTTGSYLKAGAPNGNPDFLTFDIIDNNPNMAQWLKYAAGEAADPLKNKKSPVSVFYSVQGYDYEKRDQAEVHESGLIPLPREKFFWSEIEVDPARIADGSYISEVKIYDVNGDEITGWDENPQNSAAYPCEKGPDAGTFDLKNPAYSVVSFKIPMFDSTANEPLFREPMGWYFAENSREYTDAWGNKRFGWDSSRLKFFVAVNDGQGNCNPPFWKGASLANARKISSNKLNPATDWSYTLAAGETGYFDLLAGCKIPATFGVQPGDVAAPADYESLSSATAVTNINDRWAGWPSHGGSGWQNRDSYQPVQNLPASPTQLPLEPDFELPSYVANGTWFKANYGKYGHIIVADDDPPNARIVIGGVSGNKKFCWGNAAWGDFLRPASIQCRDAATATGDTVFTRTNQDWGEYDYASASPRDIFNTDKTLYNPPLTFLGGTVDDYDDQMTFINNGKFQPWYWSVPSHPMNGWRKGYFIPEDIRVQLSGGSVDNINTWDREGFTDAGKNYVYGARIESTTIYDGTLNSNPDQGEQSFYIFRNPSMAVGPGGSDADVYARLKVADQSNPNERFDEIKLDFRVMDRKVSVQTLERR
ncbi:MAG: hypothetical protein CVV64_09450 [Candidatus Wallbacteria bacterium HGW-Wallbacteria-1]|jgi:hypothetical protein|uniref:Uncharacterized protein n=1 Tax=Candidatus Wallbacteria bacterium HGW-Wallbacteria-1 TaxID=2013854 RepID=A0A2N1PQF9_9BACT|nr:MAG: hypothetical protein CVV64_09450 [Candidatus Wallbacteria bacterium HGW-Wallbacteria-1]